MEYRGWKIEGDKTFGNFLIKRVGAGVVPGMLGGSFTNTEFAKKAVDRWLNYQEAKDRDREAKARPVVRRKPVKQE